MAPTKSQQPKVSEEELKRKYEAEFAPEIYLGEVYRKPDGADDHRPDFTKFVVSSLHRIFTLELSRGGQTLLDMGCGPTIYEAISASDYYETIVMADFLERNRQEVSKWVRKEPDAFDWTHVFQYVAKLEKEADHTKLEARLRNRLKEVIAVDLTLSNPLEPLTRTFDVIVTGSCYEAIATDDQAYKRLVARTANLLAPNGHLVVVGIFDSTYYVAGREGRFHSFPTRKDLVDEAMAEAGLEIDLWLISPMHKDVQFQSDITDFFVVLAKKKRH